MFLMGYWGADLASMQCLGSVITQQWKALRGLLLKEPLQLLGVIMTITVMETLSRQDKRPTARR